MNTPWNSPAINVCASNDYNYGSDGSNILFANPDGFKGVGLWVRQRWVEEEAASQSPSYMWERLMKPQSRTNRALKNIGDSVGKVLDLERRGREYCLESQILKQVRNLQSANEGDTNSTARAVSVHGEGTGATVTYEEDRK